jgi:cold-inducible RNA-binding protein
MAKKLYVGNLSFGTTGESLRGYFSQYGDIVSVNVIVDRETGGSKGFGFVEMATDQAAQAAISGLNGQEVDGRQIKVNEAKESTDRPQRRDNNRW